MPGKRNACVIDYALVNRTGDQRRKLTLQTTIAGASQRIHYILPVFYRQLTRDSRCPQRNR